MKRKFSFSKIAGKVRGGIVEHGPGEVGFPVVERTAGGEGADALEELGLANVDGAGIGQAERLEVRGPVEAGRLRGEFREGHLVVVALGVAEFDGVARGLGQFGLETQDGRGVARGLVGSLALEQKEDGDVPLVLAAQDARRLVVLRVILIVG